MVLGQPIYISANGLHNNAKAFTSQVKRFS